MATTVYEREVGAADLPRGQRRGIYEHLSPTHNLSQGLTAGLPAKLS
mgnify:CR=1 FL=1